MRILVIVLVLTCRRPSSLSLAQPTKKVSSFCILPIATDLREVAQVGNTVTAEHRLEGLRNSLTRQGAAAQRLDGRFSAISGVLLVTRDATEQSGQFES